MAQLSSKIECALLAAIDLAANYEPGRLIKAEDIANRTGAPINYLGQVLPRLRARALVRSTPGPGGGYELMRRPELISLAEVIDAVSSEGTRRRRSAASTRYSAALAWLSEEMEGTRRKMLSSIALTDLVRRAPSEEKS